MLTSLIEEECTYNIVFISDVHTVTQYLYTLQNV